jgi:hypothetical protein
MTESRSLYESDSAAGQSIIRVLQWSPAAQLERRLHAGCGILRRAVDYPGSVIVKQQALLLGDG